MELKVSNYLSLHKCPKNKNQFVGMIDDLINEIPDYNETLLVEEIEDYYGIKFSDLEVDEKDIPINSKKIQDFLKGDIIKENNIIKNFLPEKSILAIWGEPSSCKSFIANYIACCVSTGTNFLSNYKTRKVPVLYLSTENPPLLDKKRMKAIFKGIKINPIKRNFKNLSLEYLPRNDISIFNDEKFFNRLKNRLQQSKIKLLVIDTLSPMILDTDDNKANMVVEIFKSRLFPLVDLFGITILFLIHSQKTGKDYLGSVKLKAMPDIVYELEREDDNKLNLFCHKNREGEYNFEFKISFTNRNDILYKVNLDFIKGYEGKQTTKTKRVEVKKIDRAKDIVLTALGEKSFSYKELIDIIMKDGISKETGNRALNSLYEKEKKIKKPTKKGGYVLV